MKKHKNTISILVVLIIVLSILINYDTTSSYANESTNLLDIDTNKSRISSTFMTKQGLWAPGIEQSGVIRINNNDLHKIKVDSMGLAMILEKQDGTIIEPNDPEGLYNRFAQSMKLTFKRSKLLSLPIFKGNFFKLLYIEEENNYDGFSIPLLKQFKVGEDNVDLIYTVKMDESASNELQGLKATVKLIVNINNGI